jgi:flagellar hook-length control protein FliK
MSLVSDPEPASDAVAESAGLPLMPAGFDGKSALPDVSNTLVAGQIVGGVDPLLMRSDTHIGIGNSQSADVSTLPVVPSQILQTQTASPSTVAIAVAAPVVALPASASVLTEESEDAVQIDVMATRASNDMLSVALAAQGKQPEVARSRVESPSDTAQTAVPAPLVTLDTRAPASTPMPIEKTLMSVPRRLVDVAKAETNLDANAKQTSFNKEPATQTPSPSHTQAMIPGIGDENVSALAPKASGVWTSQQISLAGQLRHDATTLRPDFSGANSGAAVTLPGQILAVSQQDAGVRALERPIKQHHNRFGSGGEGVYGQPLASANPADSLFQVVPTTSAAASTVVAETVSYWASQGVHSASLQLEGLGDEPVEVRISVNGDMAQVDFRTNQPEVRQTIEAAASQLKELLTSQGIQLTGMSIGTSGRGGSQEKDTKRTPEGRKVAMLKSEAVEKPRLRGANPSVGQALDLFV